MKKPKGSHGIYFVIRLPDRWQLVAFPFDSHADGGHPEFWEAFVTKMLVEAWSPKLFKGKDPAQRQRGRTSGSYAGHLATQAGGRPLRPPPYRSRLDHGSTKRYAENS